MPTFTHLESGDSCEIVVDRRIDGEAANKLEIDLLAVIRVLLQYHRKMKMDHKSLLVSRASAEVDTILELTGFRESLLEKQL